MASTPDNPPPLARDFADGRVHYLDGLRGWAALSVLLFHYMYMFQPAVVFGPQPGLNGGEVAWIYATPFYSVISGGFAVSIFFVLSGFVLTLPFCRTRDRSMPVKGLLRRYPRLALPVLAANLLYGLLLASGLMNRSNMLQVAALSGQGAGEVYFGDTVQWLPLIKHALWDVFQETSYTYNPVLWTMHTELIGSIFVLGLIWLVGGSRMRWWVYAFWTAICVWRWPVFLAFLLGLLLSEAHVADRLKCLRPLALQIVLLVLVFYIGGIPTHPLEAYGQSPAYHWVYELTWLPTANRRWLVLIAASTCLIAVILEQPRLQDWLQNTPGRFLGRISFGLYLTHCAVLSTAGCALFLWLLNWFTVPAASWLVLPVVVPLSLVAGWMLTVVADEPAIIFSRAFSRHAENTWRRIIHRGHPIDKPTPKP